MAEAIEKVPAETRWEIAAKGLTGAITAIDKALKDAIGENKFNEFVRSFGTRLAREQKSLQTILD